jgi:hypothetical protein
MRIEHIVDTTALLLGNLPQVFHLVVLLEHLQLPGLLSDLLDLLHSGLCLLLSDVQLPLKRLNLSVLLNTDDAKV